MPSSLGPPPAALVSYLDLAKWARASLVLSLLCLTACATTTHWQPRSMAPCLEPLKPESLELERARVAAMLALDAQGYAILAATKDTIEAQFYRSEAARVHWILRIGPQASISAEISPEQQHVHRKTGFWYERLAHRLATYRCRELEWLRWEAQNRGLLAVAPALAADATGPQTADGSERAEAVGTGEGGGGAGETTGHAPDASAAPTAENLHERGEMLIELNRRRSELHLGRAVAWGAAGVVITASGLSLMVQGLLYRAQPCDEYDNPALVAEDCGTRDAGRALAIAGGALQVLGGTVIAVSFPRLFSRMRRYKALGREIKALKSVEIASGARSTPFGFMLRSSF